MTQLLFIFIHGIKLHLKNNLNSYFFRKFYWFLQTKVRTDHRVHLHQFTTTNNRSSKIQDLKKAINKP